MSRFFAITGTDTEIGKTVVTAVFAAAALIDGRSVAAYKPTQTGVEADDEGDVQSVVRWLNSPDALTAAEGVRLIPAMAPDDARQCQASTEKTPVPALPTIDEHAEAIRALGREHDVVLVEGAGGLLVRLTETGGTIADIARAVDARPVVAARPDLGTLNHTELTLEAAERRGLEDGVLIMGSRPVNPDRLHRINRENLEALAQRYGWTWAPGPLAGIVSGSPDDVAENLHAAGQALLTVSGIFSR